MAGAVKPANRKRQKFEGTARRQEMIQLYRDGFTQQYIADQMGCTRENIAMQLKRVRIEWLSQSLIDLAERMAVEESQIVEVQNKAVLAWYKSCTPKVKRTEKVKDGEEGQETEHSVTDENQCGDPRYLEVMLKCIERRCKLFGISTEDTLTIRGDPANPIKVEGPELVTFEQLNAMPLAEKLRYVQDRVNARAKAIRFVNKHPADTVPAQQENASDGTDPEAERPGGS